MKLSINKQKILDYLQHNFLFILMILIIAFLEINIYNNGFYINFFHNLRENYYEIEDGTLYGFDDKNGYLLSEHIDPNLTYNQIDQRVRYIKVQCANPNPEALSQVFFRREDQDFIEENSITFPLSGAETVIKLPRTIKVTSLRLDLTNQSGDRLTCEGITINPEIPFKLNYVSLLFLTLSILGLIWGRKVIPTNYSERLWSIFMVNRIWIFVLIIILVDFLYPVTVTFDSAHYIWLADIIKQGDWAKWDPIRFIGFPLHIFLSLQIFGENQYALLIPMISAHVLLFVFSHQIIMLVFKSILEKYRLLVSLVIFLVIAMDPTIVGYFHTLLTEYTAATIAILSCYVALKLYQTALFSKRFFMLSSYFLVMVSIAWHIKQPYIGAALFPFLIAAILIVLRKITWKTGAYAVAATILLVAVTLSSTSIWNTFIQTQGNPMRENRQISTVIERNVGRQIDSAQENLSDSVVSRIEHYLKMTNFYLRSSSGIRSTRNLTMGFQNKVIGQRMYYNLGETNLLFKSDYYSQFTRFLKTRYSPPVWINNLFLSRTVLSNFLFTASYLLLPIQLPVVFIFWIRKKNMLPTALLLLGGTALFNTVVHMLANPIDRYLFLGFPLNLLALLMLLVQAVHIIKNKVFIARSNQNPDLNN